MCRRRTLAAAPPFAHGLVITRGIPAAAVARRMHDSHAVNGIARRSVRRGEAIMRSRHLLAYGLVTALILSGCVSTTTTTRTWGDPHPYAEPWARFGRVSAIRETVQSSRGNPAAGAVAGAAIGGILGSMVGARSHHRHYHPSAAGAVLGAAGGAMVGAVASQGRSEDRTYEVFVRFEDGGYESFVYPGYAPFRVGDPVQLTPGGLARI
jgi:outer membrane lipoprotein SlyB